MQAGAFSRRRVNALGFATCAGLMAYALYTQYGLGLDPCPLCIFQRVALIALGLVFLAAALHDPQRKGSIVYAALGDLAALAGAGFAGRHVWLQSLPPDEVPACGPGLNYLLDTLPVFEALGQVFRGSGECADVSWTFLGLNMPAWVLIWFIVLGVLVVANNLRPQRSAAN